MKRPSEVLTPEETDALLASFGSSWTEVRNKAMVAVALYSGVRCQSLLDLIPTDVNLSDYSVRLRNAKGGKYGVVGLNPAVVPHLNAWLAIRPNSKTLFCTSSGKKVLACYVRAMMTRAGTRAGIEHRVHPHALRTTHAITLSQRGVPIHLIAGQLMHSSVATTSVYLSKYAASDVVNAVKAVAW